MANEQNFNQQNYLGTLISRLLGRVRKAKEGEVLDDFELYIDRLKKILQEVDQKWVIVSKWIMVISNYETGENIPSILEKGKRRGLMEAYNKKWIGFGIALTLYRLLLLEINRHGQGFTQEKPQFVSRIYQFDPQLAQKINPLNLSPNEESEIFGQLRGILNNPQLVTAYIKTHYDEIIRRLDTFQDKKKSAKLRRIMIILSNREAEELIKCVDDIRRWPYRADRVAYGINLFMERINLFLNGGKSNYDGESFLGFNLYFKDKEFASEIFRTPEVRKLVYYLKEIEFFRGVAYAIRKSVQTEGKWEGFYEFYNNLDRGRNYIQMVRETFGNEEFANLLETFKEKKHESPVDWERELEKLERDLENPVYADKFVVESAANALVRIFETKIIKLQGEEATALKNLRQILTKEDTTAIIRQQFLKILAKKRQELQKELKTEEIEFEALISDIILTMPEFDLKMEQAMDTADTTEELLAEGRVLDASLNWRRFVIANISSFEDDLGVIQNRSSIQALTRALAGSYNSLRASLSEAKIESRVKFKHKQSLIMIQDLIKVAEKQLLPSLAKCLVHINAKLKYYTSETQIFLSGYQDDFRPGKTLQFRAASQPTSKGFVNLQGERKVA